MLKHKNIVLIGFMGVGKSLTARWLADYWQRPLFSTDAWVESQAGKSITAVFSEDGEPVFRQWERRAVDAACQLQGVVIDCGGGVITDLKNMARLKSCGLVCYLAASPEQIYERIKEQRHRPLLLTDDPQGRIRELLAQRRSAYEQADYRIDTDGKTIEATARDIIAVVTKAS